MTRYKINKTSAYPGLDSYLIQKELSHYPLLVIITENTHEALRLKEELKAWLPEKKILYFPDWETLPYDRLSPHQGLISERISCLQDILTANVDVILVNISTALQKLPPTSFIASARFQFHTGELLDLPKLKAQLAQAYYQAVEHVVAHCEYRIKGGMLDIFPVNSVLPYRIELNDNIIEKIYAFDIDTQRALYPVKDIYFVAAREFFVGEADKKRFLTNYQQAFPEIKKNSQLCEDISKGILFAGVEYYLPLFFSQTHTFYDYLPKDSLIIEHGVLDVSGQEFWQDLKKRYHTLNYDPQYPLLTPQHLYQDIITFFDALKTHPHRMKVQRTEPPTSVDLKSYGLTEFPLLQANNIHNALKSYKGKVSLVLIAESIGRRQTLYDLLQQNGIKITILDNLHEALTCCDRLILTIGSLSNIVIIPEQNTIFFTEQELLGIVRRQKNKQAEVTEKWIGHFSELTTSQPIIHRLHGVGRYQNMIVISNKGIDSEFIQISYANNDMLYVPIYDMPLLSHYNGPIEMAPLHRLGSQRWQKNTEKAEKSAFDTAARLLNLYASRETYMPSPFLPDDANYTKMVERFPYEETEDQKNAITAVIKDLERPDKAMDRLICGDVGFGKTEIAIRAAYLVGSSGQQVALLCPTTLLVEQHYRVFSDRYAGLPINIAYLSRLADRKYTQQVLNGLADGTIHLVIATHRVLQKDIIFKNLGLIILDEEHRFGVEHKEKLKSLHLASHVLAMTATPIPRTLAMSLEGIRDLSIITTPPQKRLPIKTFQIKFDKSIIREAILREIRRGGQVYFLHNNIQDIEIIAEQLNELVPEARLIIAHAQMPEKEMAHVIRAFQEKRYNILLSTTIIENGIDNANANTIIINNANNFGLAQLHQIRGRVGRSHHQAYTYLIVPEEVRLKKNAQLRLETIKNTDSLGVGFYLASQDLEIRGSGELLGESQSGNIHEVGFSIYHDMLQSAVDMIRSGKSNADFHREKIEETIDLHTSCFLPEKYCPNIDIRLTIYKRMSDAKDYDELLQVREWVIDHYGLLPDPATHLFYAHQIKLKMKKLGINSIDASSLKIVISFSPQTTIDSQLIFASVQHEHGRFLSNYTIVFSKKTPIVIERIHFILQLMKNWD